MAQTVPVKRPELRTPLARAVVPVLAGIAFFALLGLVLWVFAILIANDQESVTNLTPDQFEVGPIGPIAATISETGPILFPGLGPDSGDRTLVLDHEGDDPTEGWIVRFAHPADRDESCAVTQVQETATFTDCDGRTVTVDDLAPPPGIYPVVPDDKTLFIDLREANGKSTSTSTSATQTTGD